MTIGAKSSAAGKDASAIPRCLYRATNGSKKISTVVTAGDISRFQASYSAVVRGSMSSLKKRAKKTKGEAAPAAA